MASTGKLALGIKLLEQKLDFENEYRYVLIKKMEKVRRRFIGGAIGFGVALALTIIAACMILPIALNGETMNAGDKAGWTIMAFSGSMLSIIALPAFIVTLIIIIKYGKRYKGDIDPRDNKWRTYDDMMTISENRTKDATARRIELITELEASRFEDNEYLEVDDMSDGPEGEKVRDDVIPFSELLKAKGNC